MISILQFLIPVRTYTSAIFDCVFADSINSLSTDTINNNYNMMYYYSDVMLIFWKQTIAPFPVNYGKFTVKQDNWIYTVYAQHF